MATDGQGPAEHPGETPGSGAVPIPGLQHVHSHDFPIRLRFFEEIKRRNLVRVAVLYLIVCWVILEPTHVVFHMLEVPAWANRLVLLLMVAGFPLVLLFSWIYEITPHGVRPTVEVDRAKSIRRETARRLDRAIIVVLSLALVYFVADKFWLSKRTDAKTHEEASATGKAATSGAASSASMAVNDKSIAVLPFVDMSEKKDQEYFSDGLSEELIDLLARVPDLHVPARTSSFYFKGKSEDVASIAQRLHVTHVLEGSVRKAANTIRVTVQLIRADNGYHLWSKAYDRDVKDVFKVQDDIAAAVVEALKAQLLPAQQVTSRHRTVNTEAYSLYLLGNQLRSRDTVESNARALAAYQRAIALDPNYAAAYSGLSDAELRVADKSTGEDAGFQRAALAAEHAIALAPDLPDGYRARGRLRETHNLDFRGAQADYERALALDPSYVGALIDNGRITATLGHLEDGIATLRKATVVDPLSVVTWRTLGNLLLDAGHNSSAREASGRALEINPDGTDNWFFGKVELFDRHPDEALTAFRNRTDTYGMLMGTALAEHSLGHPAESQRALDGLIKGASGTWAYQIACVYAWRGEVEKSLEWLDRAHRQYDGGLGSLPHDRFFASMRDDPRYKALLRKLNLPQ